MKNNLKDFLLVLIFFSVNFYNSDAQNIEVIVQEIEEGVKDPIRDIPKKINYKYVNPIIPDKETALLYADVIFKKRYKNVDFDSLKPYDIKLVAEDWIWEVKVTQETFQGKYTYFYLRINKNTGEIVNSWADR